MEFRQLEYFCAIAEVENFTRTAQMLHVSQPSVTKAIKSLEAELELTLINRSQRHVMLTEEGRAFLIHAQRIMKEMEEARQDMERFRHATHGVIHFGIPPMVEAYLFPDLFVKFRRAFPEINLDVQEYSDSQEVLERVELGELHFGIVMMGPGERGENTRHILSDTMSLCIGKGHPFSDEERLDFRALSGEKFILQQPRTYQYHEVFKRTRKAGFTPEVVLCTSQLKTIKQLVADGVAISFLPDFATNTEKNFLRKEVVPPINLEVLLCWGSHKILSQIDKRFIDFVRASVAHSTPGRET